MGDYCCYNLFPVTIIKRENTMKIREHMINKYGILRYASIIKGP